MRTKITVRADDTRQHSGTTEDKQNINHQSLTLRDAYELSSALAVRTDYIRLRLCCHHNHFPLVDSVQDLNGTHETKL